MEFELRVPCLEGLTDMPCENCHICANRSPTYPSKTLHKQQQQQKIKTTNANNLTSFSLAVSTTLSDTPFNLKTLRILNLTRLCIILLVFNLFTMAAGCGPGRGIGGPRPKRKLTPLVFKQHVPNMSEQTLGASGISEGPINRDSAKFKKLEFNNNRDIIFKDEEGTGADHVMTRVSA